MSERREERLKFIRELLSANKIRTQEALAQALEKGGFSITQASLSRDLSHLGVVKRDSVYLIPEAKDSASILSMTPAGQNLLVIRTLPGMAPPLAYKIDEAKIEGIVGTIAGENTIFVAIRPEVPMGRIRQKLSHHL